MPQVKSLSLISGGAPHFEILRNHGFDIELPPPDVNLFEEAHVIQVLKDCEATVAGSEPYTRRVIESLPKLRVIARSGVGYDAVDLAACDDAGVVVTTTPGVNHHAVAEHAIALLMGVARGFPDLDRRVRTNEWDRVSRPRVMGATLGIVGLGAIGRAVATRAVGLGMTVIAYEPFPNKEFVDWWKIPLVELDELLGRSDYVSLHLPMSAQTRHTMNADTFAKMKPGSVLINTARGGLVNEQALVQALKSGRLRAAGLDVFEVEPLPLDSPLLKFDNVLLSGHVAGLDHESHAETFQLVAETIIDLYHGGWPARCIVNMKGVTGWKWQR